MPQRYTGAVRTWLSLVDRPSLTEAQLDQMEAAEVAILSRAPSCDEELRLLLSVVRHNLIAGPRSDERDITALANAEAYLVRPKAFAAYG